MGDELRWCAQCDEWMYAKDCKGDAKLCGRASPDNFETVWKIVYGTLGILFIALLIIQLVSLALHLGGLFP